MIGTVARVGLGALLAMSGALKLWDRSWPTAARALGAPRWSVPLIAPIEIVLGACLVSGVAKPWTTWVALGLLVTFSVVLALVLRRPLNQRPACACFGHWSAKPVRVGSLVRNFVLTFVAVVALL